MLATDVVVAGGGVAGLLIASALAPKFAVVLLEQSDSLPHNKYWLTDALAANDDAQLNACIDKNYNTLDFVAYDGLTATVEGTYCLWDTENLIGFLAERLLKNGARLLTGHQLYAFWHERNKILIRANSQILPFLDYKSLPSYLIAVCFVVSVTYNNDPAVQTFMKYLLNVGSK